MDIFEHESQYKVHLCEYTNEPIFICFRSILQSALGAQQSDKWSGMDISVLRLIIDKEVITVQSETYIGIDVFGPQPIVDDIMERVRLKMQALQKNSSNSSTPAQPA